ncbi:MAG: sensor histidine kinase [Cryomorphaceae bacterium]
MTNLQDKTFASDLDEVYETWVKVMIMEIDVDHLNAIAIPDITGFGTTIDENIQGIEAVRKLIEKQISESENAQFHFDRHQLRKRMLAEGRAALMVEEGEIKLELAEGTVQFPFRMSAMLERTDGRWKVVHWHGSTPVMSEDDTWHINDWKTKNERLEAQVAEKTKDLEESLVELKATQEQLILQEKLAGLGQLAAGIAHEIKNPMNFVNNFSELSLEYIDEIRTALSRLEKGEATEEITDLLGDVEENLKKIHQHGTRADSIVKSMLMHSRGGNGISEPTDLNELIREYVNLSFHGMRAGKIPINVKIELDLEENLPPVSLNPEDFSRVVLNLCKNAFDAMREKGLKQENGDYKAVLKVQTKKQGNHAALTIEDNGPGVPDTVRNKLFEPFFTTKKGTEGTGLGLSITRDIIKSHKGEINLESSDNEFTRFTIELPI